MCVKPQANKNVCRTGDAFYRGLSFRYFRTSADDLPAEAKVLDPDILVSFVAISGGFTKWKMGRVHQ